MKLWQKFKSTQPFFYKKEILKVGRGKDGERVTTSFKARSYGFTATGWASINLFLSAIFAFYGHWITFGVLVVIALFWTWRGCLDRKAFEAIRPRLEEYLGLDKYRSK